MNEIIINSYCHNIVVLFSEPPVLPDWIIDNLQLSNV